MTADQQHSTIEVNDLSAMFAAIELRGAVPSTRVPLNDYISIGGALDLGAQMVIVPMVNNAEEARRAVAAFRYPPRGNRSAGAGSAAVRDGLVAAGARGARPAS